MKSKNTTTAAAAPAAPTTPAAETATPTMSAEPAAAATFVPIPLEVSGAKKKALRSLAIWAPSDLYVDSSGTFATDGREALPVDFGLVRSLIRHYTTDNKGRVFPLILPVKVTIAGTDDKPLLVVLNGRQRIKAIEEINAFMAKIYRMFAEDLGRDVVKLKNILIAQSESGRNQKALAEAAAEAGTDYAIEGPDYRDMAWITEEDVYHLVGGRVNGEAVSGLLRKSKDSEDGPMPYAVRVEYVDVDPNSPEALEISLAERINVPTPPTIQAKQLQRLLAAGRSVESVAASNNCDTRSVFNRMLVLHTIPEVQAALDAGRLSWQGMRQAFFTDTKKSGPVVKAPEEQKQILDILLANNAGKGRTGKGLRESLSGKEKPPADPPADPPKTTETPPAEPPAPAPAAATPRNVSTTEFRLVSYSKAGSEVRSRALRLPRPNADGDSDTYWAAREAIVRAETAANVLEFLTDPSALDDMPDLKAMIVAALAETEAAAAATHSATPVTEPAPAAAEPAKVEEAPAKAEKPKKADKAEKGKKKGKELTPAQKLAASLTALFTEHDDAKGDKGEWPVTDEPEMAAALGKIQAEYAEKLKSVKNKKKAPDKSAFARDWIARTLLGIALS